MRDYIMKVSEMKKAAQLGRVWESGLETGRRNYGWLEEQMKRGAEVLQSNGSVIKCKKDKNGRILRYIIAGYKPDGSDSTFTYLYLMDKCAINEDGTLRDHDWESVLQHRGGMIRCKNCKVIQ